MSQKIPRIPFLLRKSRGGHEAPVARDEDFPFRFHRSGKTYVVELTKAGKVLMTVEKIE